MESIRAFLLAISKCSYETEMCVLNLSVEIVTILEVLNDLY